MELTKEQRDALVAAVVGSQWERRTLDVAPGDLGPDEGGCTLLAVSTRVHDVTDDMVRTADGYVVVRERTEVRHDASDNSVVWRHSTLRRGRAWRSPERKLWARWKLEDVVRVRELSDGSLLSVSRSADGHYTSQRLYGAKTDWRGSGPEVIWGWQNALLASLLDVTPPPFDVVHPLAMAAGLDAQAPSAMLAPFRGASDAIELTRAMFGKRAYRKDLARAVGRCLTDQSVGLRLHTAHLFRGLVPVDWLVLHLGGRGPDVGVRHLSSSQIVALRRAVRGLDERSRRRLLLGNERGFGGYELADLARFARQVAAPTRTESWRDLHDAMSVLAQGEAALQGLRKSAAFRAAEKKDFAVELAPEHAVLEGQTAGGHRIVLARNGTTLDAWGSQLRHCIATYKVAMFRGLSLLGGVESADGTLLANFELRHDDESLRLVQLQGYKNSRPSEAIRRDVLGHLEQHGVLTARPSWYPVLDQDQAA